MKTAIEKQENADFEYEYDHEDDYVSYTEKIFAFKPRWRDGRGRSTREVKLREKSASKLYGKRLMLADTFSQTTGDNAIKEMNKTLIFHEMSASLYSGISNIVESLSLKDGSLDYVRNKMAKEVEAVKNSQKRLRVLFFWNTYIFFFINILKLSLFSDNSIVSDFLTIFSLLSAVIFFYLFTFKAMIEHKSIKNKFIGSDNKSHNDFTTYQQALIFDR